MALLLVGPPRSLHGCTTGHVRSSISGSSTGRSDVAYAALLLVGPPLSMRGCTVYTVQCTTGRSDVANVALLLVSQM